MILFQNTQKSLEIQGPILVRALVGQEASPGLAPHPYKRQVPVSGATVRSMDTPECPDASKASPAFFLLATTQREPRRALKCSCHTDFKQEIYLIHIFYPFGPVKKERAQKGKRKKRRKEGRKEGTEGGRKKIKCPAFCLGLLRSFAGHLWVNAAMQQQGNQSTGKTAFFLCPAPGSCLRARGLLFFPLYLKEKSKKLSRGHYPLHSSSSCKTISQCTVPLGLEWESSRQYAAIIGPSRGKVHRHLPTFLSSAHCLLLLTQLILPLPCLVTDSLKKPTEPAHPTKAAIFPEEPMFSMSH